MTDPNLNRLLANRYQLQQLIGIGGMGQVYLAKDTLLGGVPVAVKFLALSIQSQKFQMQERFEREAKTCALLGQKSIHIVRVMDYGVDENGTAFYVMEYLQGNDLNHAIRIQPFTLARFLNIARQISLGLLCAHQGIALDGSTYPIIHRDIKPSNIILIQDASFGELAKVLDFGLAKLIQPESKQTSYYLGTMAYSSPEQMEGKELDNRSDIYSLGVMMFEMLTGKLPLNPLTGSFGAWYEAHHHQVPRSFTQTDPRVEIPQQLQDLIMSCLAKTPTHRPHSISEIVQTLVTLEQRYGAVDPVKQRFGEAVITQTLSPDLTNFQPSFSVIDESIEQAVWPKDKPIADIVFAYPVHSQGKTSPALWAMLPQSEIRKRLRSKRYNQFLFIASPQPMMLWLTVLYNHEHGAKWFPYYLDLKTAQGQETTNLLGTSGYYRLLLFAKELVQKPTACLTFSIATAQSQLFQDWIATSQLAAAGDSRFSKSVLKQELEKLKPQILAKLEVTQALVYPELRT